MRREGIAYKYHNERPSVMPKKQHKSFSARAPPQIPHFPPPRCLTSQCLWRFALGARAQAVNFSLWRHCPECIQKKLVWYIQLQKANSVCCKQIQMNIIDNTQEHSCVFFMPMTDRLTQQKLLMSCHNFITTEKFISCDTIITSGMTRICNFPVRQNCSYDRKKSSKTALRMQ